LIEENLIIFRIENWLMPLIEAIILLIKQKITIIFWVVIIKSISRGTIFWIVDRIKQLNQFKPSIVDGTQKWNGKNPIFILKAIKKSIKNKGLVWG